MIILIPAYEPDQRGSCPSSVPSATPSHGSRWWWLTTAADRRTKIRVRRRQRPSGATSSGTQRNRGKGFALKTGFGFIADQLPDPERGVC